MLSEVARSRRDQGRGSRGKRASFECPHCGARVRAGALACPECGADAETGWSEGGDVWGVDVPSGYGRDEDFHYDDFLAREGLGGRFFSRRRVRRLGMQALVFALALLLLIWLLAR